METQDSSPESAAPDALRGVLILGPDGKELASGGIATQRDLAARIVSGWHDARRHQRRVFSVEGPDGSAVVVVALTTSDATALVAMQREGRDPLFELVSSVDFAGDILAHFFNNPFEAMTVVDKDGLLR